MSRGFIYGHYGDLPPDRLILIVRKTITVLLLLGKKPTFKMATTAQQMENPFAFTATGDLGIARETMLQNELLLRVRNIVMCFRDIIIHDVLLVC